MAKARTGFPCHNTHTKSTYYTVFVKRQLNSFMLKRYKYPDDVVVSQNSRLNSYSWIFKSCVILHRTVGLNVKGLLDPEDEGKTLLRTSANVYHINKIQRYATVCRRLFTEKLHVSGVFVPIIRRTSNCNCSFWYRSYHVSEQQLSASVA